MLKVTNGVADPKLKLIVKLSLSGSVIEGSIMLFDSPAIILNTDIKGVVKVGGPVFNSFNS